MSSKSTHGIGRSHQVAYNEVTQLWGYILHLRVSGIPLEYQTGSALLGAESSFYQ